jgi:hypothetical protein
MLGYKCYINVMGFHKRRITVPPGHRPAGTRSQGGVIAYGWEEKARVFMEKMCCAAFGVFEAEM